MQAGHRAWAGALGVQLSLLQHQRSPIYFVILHDEDVTPHTQDYLLPLDARGPEASLFYLEMLDGSLRGHGTRPERLPPVPKPPPGVSLSP